MKGKNVFEITALRLRVETPVHIGSRHGFLNALEFIRHEGRIFVLDEEKMGNFLLKKNLLERFCQAAYSDELRRKGIYGFLRDYCGRINIKNIEDLAAYSVPGGGYGMGQFRPFVRDGRNRIFLPGSSIKGALRTAVLYRCLKRAGVNKWMEKVRHWIEELEATSPNRRFNKSTRLSESMQKDLLQHCVLENLRDQKGKHQNRDLLRCLKVRDAYPVEDGKLETRVIPVYFLARNGEGLFYRSKNPQSRDDLIVWVEAVVEGTFETELLWDLELFERFRRANSDGQFPVESPEDVLKCVVEMNRDVMEEERKFFESPSGDGRKWALGLKNWYEKSLKGSWLRVGYGAGMLSTTVNLLWPHESLRQKVRNVCGHNRGKDPAPKTRRVWPENDNTVKPLGWARLFYRKGEEDSWQPVGVEVTATESKPPVADGTERIATGGPTGSAFSGKGMPVAMYPSSAAKPVEKGQEREGTLHMKDKEWFARFEGDARDAVIENPQLIPSGTEEGTKAIFYIVYQSKKKGIKARILKVLS
ncbi:type III-A CRISPR-associated RAMP protein Csm5 [Thermodesulforhabdus norvegica]|uniref:CRISPR system Cms protein Csm5 n=1 Tax=Thermodesulforhabdus norvegica TaxID=39841 RepID=A0A1I4TB50_9BACT|nr:type III-A CRISPR-associated RAMP protein Csm5 [Thermodesulforhabdus norvegica]SFM74008.1 RAMP superfamily protein [Thermodesulforhabdus norvegica]